MPIDIKSAAVRKPPPKAPSTPSSMTSDSQMTDSFDLSRPSSFAKHAQGPLGRRSSVRQSYTSWISSLANSHAGPQATSPPPMPAAFDVHSPASTVRTIKVSQVPLQRLDPPPAAKIEAATPTEEEPELSEFGVERKEMELMSPVEEVSEHATSGVSPLRGRARSIMGGFVSSLRSLPRAVTHGQLYDRTSFSHRGSVRGSRASHGSDRHYPYPTSSDATGTGYNLKYPEQPLPYTLPILLAPPPPFAPPAFRAGTPFSGSLGGPRDSKFGSEMGLTAGTGRVSHGRSASASAAGAGGLGSLLTELNSLPWVAPSRVAVDYVPGVGRRSSQNKTSSSWYTVAAPETPSDISQRWRKLPDPWFPPQPVSQALTSPVEGPVEETGVVDAEAEGEGGEEAVLPEAEAPEAADLKEELLAKNRSLLNLRQVLEHQKMHISSLESQLEDMRRVNEEAVRRRSTLRKSLRARDSVRVSRLSTRRTSVRVSRASSLIIS